MTTSQTTTEQINACNIQKKDLSFEQLMEIYNHIGEEERHFNNLELEYRKLASQWLLVSLGAIGFVLSKQEVVLINSWILVIGISIAASVGILVLWLLDLKVYHELLHGAFKEGVLLEKQFPQFLPQIRNNMVKSQKGGDIITRVILYYFFSILLLILIANISAWMYIPCHLWWLNICINCISVFTLFITYKLMTDKSSKSFKADTF